MSKQKGQKRQKGTRKKLIIGAGIIVLLVLAVAAGVIAQLLQRSAQEAKDKSNFTTSDSGLPQAVDKAQQQAVTGKTSDAQKTIDDALKVAETNDQKRQLYLQQGIIYENQNQYDQAIASYKKAEELGITFTIALRLAETYEAKGDKAAAIDYYKKAIANIDQKSPLKEEDKQNLEEQIRNLGGQP